MKSFKEFLNETSEELGEFVETIEASPIFKGMKLSSKEFKNGFEILMKGKKIATIFDTSPIRISSALSLKVLGSVPKQALIKRTVDGINYIESLTQLV